MDDEDSDQSRLRKANLPYGNFNKGVASSGLDSEIAVMRQGRNLFQIEKEVEEKNKAMKR